MTSDVVCQVRSGVWLNPVKRAPTPLCSSSHSHLRHCWLHSPVRVTSLSSAYTSSGAAGTTIESFIS